MSIKVNEWLILFNILKFAYWNGKKLGLSSTIDFIVSGWCERRGRGDPRRGGAARGGGGRRVQALDFEGTAEQGAEQS